MNDVEFKHVNSTKVALFDLDYTFVATNSTSRFIEFYAARYFTIRKKLKFAWVRFLYFIGSGFFKKNQRDAWIGFLSGESTEKVSAAAIIYCKDKLSHKIDVGILRYFSDLKSKGFKTALVSASIDPVVSAFAKYLQFDDWFGGVLEISGRSYTGLFENDFTGKKHGVLDLLEHDYGKLDLRESYFFTDNKEDLVLAKKIGNSYGVIRGNFENIFWERNGIKTFSASSNDSSKSRRYAIPLLYFLLVRTASLTDKHLWFYYIGFSIFSLAVFGIFSLWNVFWMFISLAGFYSIYEIGYLVNDSVSAKYEKKPTIRISQGESFSRFWFVVNRLLFFTVICTLLVFFYGHDNFVLLYIAANILTAAIFEIHNIIRSYWRQVTLPLLKIAHFLVPLALFPKVNLITAAIIIAIIYVPGHVFIYHRKVYNRETPDRREMINYIVFPTCAIIVILFILNLAGFLSWPYSFLSWWLFVGHFIKILKLASPKSESA